MLKLLLISPRHARGSRNMKAVGRCSNIKAKGDDMPNSALRFSKMLIMKKFHAVNVNFLK